MDAHAALINQKVLNIAGINVSTKIEGRSIELKDGQPKDILIGNAMDIEENKIPLIEDTLVKGFFYSHSKPVLVMVLQVCMIVAIESILLIWWMKKNQAD